jgi:hypothetical protein
MAATMATMKAAATVMVTTMAMMPAVMKRTAMTTMTQQWQQ